MWLFLALACQRTPPETAAAPIRAVDGDLVDWPGLGDGPAPALTGFVGPDGLWLAARQPAVDRSVVTVALPGAAAHEVAMRPEHVEHAIRHLCAAGAVADEVLPDSPLRRHVVIEGDSATVVSARGAPVGPARLGARERDGLRDLELRLGPEVLPYTDQPTVTRAFAAVHPCDGSEPSDLQELPETPPGMVACADPALRPQITLLAAAGFAFSPVCAGDAVRWRFVDGAVAEQRVDPRALRTVEAADGVPLVATAPLGPDDRPWLFAADPQLDRPYSAPVARDSVYGRELAFADGTRWMIPPGADRVVAWPDPDAACDPWDDSCYDAIGMVLSAERAALLSEDPGEPGAVHRCEVPLEDCVGQLDAEHYLHYGDDVVITVPEALEEEEEEEPSWELVRFGVRPPPDLEPEPPFELVELGHRPITDPFSLALLDRTEGLGVIHDDRLLAQLTLAPGASWSSPRLVDAAPFVVCPDRVVRPDAPTPTSTEVAVSGFLDATTYGFSWVYDLPCEAELVIDADVEGVRPGPRRDVGPLASPSAVTADCPDDDPSTTCTIEWSGDLNADGATDVVIRRVGEMGCGELTLHLSTPDGTWQPAAVAMWDC